MRSPAVIATVLFSSGVIGGCVPVLERPFYCGRDADCSWGWTCDLSRNECVSPSDTRGDDETTGGDTWQPGGDDTHGDHAPGGDELSGGDQLNGGDELDPGDELPPADQDTGIPLWAQLGSGREVFCLISTTGEVSCSGLNNYGQTNPPPGTYLEVDCGIDHCCGLLSDYTLVCWGAGEETTVDPHYGQSAAPTSGTFKAIAAGEYLSCAIDAADGITCWGDIAAQVTAAGTYQRVAVGRNLVCGIRISDSKAECWGLNAVTAPDVAFKQITIGYDYAVGIDAVDQLHYWSNFIDVGGVESELPTDTFKSVSAGDGHVCGVRTDDTLSCWGARDLALGQDQAPPGIFLDVGSGALTTCGVKSDNTATCWGMSI